MAEARPEPVLDEEETRAFLAGVAQFNGGFFFECHETLEDVWMGVRGPARDFFQGLIQVSVAFHHLTSGNPAGAESLLGRALKRFQGYPDRYFGFDLAAHRQELLGWLDAIRSGATAAPPLESLPKWRFG